jgi:hypothetical protein
MTNQYLIIKRSNCYKQNKKYYTIKINNSFKIIEKNKKGIIELELGDIKLDKIIDLRSKGMLTNWEDWWWNKKTNQIIYEHRGWENIINSLIKLELELTVIGELDELVN